MVAIAIPTATIMIGGAAAKSAAEEGIRRMEALGARTILLAPRSPAEVGAEGFRRYLRLSDGLAIRQRVPGAARVVPELMYAVEAAACGEVRPATVIGVTASGLRGSGWPVKGVQATLSPAVFDGESRIALVGERIVEQLRCLAELPSSMTVGRTLLTVRGHLKASHSDIDLTSAIVVPVHVAESVLGDLAARPVSFRIEASDSVNLDELERQVTAALRDLHGIRGDEPDDFVVSRQTDLVRRWHDALGQARRRLTLLLSWAFLLSAASVANAIAASIAERTGEIGIRRAIGASSSAILAQFVVEGMVLATFGTIAGIAVGALVAPPIVEGAIDAPYFTDWVVVAGASAGNVLLSIIASALPAASAGSLSPMEAIEA